jgi:hypothetical protein
MRLYLLLVFTIFLAKTSFAQSPIWEESATNISVYVQSKDAKFVGTSMGGAYIRVTEKLTGDVLAEGKTYGGSGNTDLIMTDNKKRGAVIVDKETASFDFSLDLLEPTMVTISATGPLAQQQSLVTVSKDMLLLPHKDYTSGNGVLIEIPGMVVDVLAPAANQQIPFNPEKPVTFVANITKLCGCVIEKGSHWPPERYEVEAYIFRDSAFVGTLPLESLGKSQYAANLKIPVPGTYNITVTAFDKETKEAGFDRTTIVLNKNEDLKTTE